MFCMDIAARRTKDGSILLQTPRSGRRGRKPRATLGTVTHMNLLEVVYEVQYETHSYEADPLLCECGSIL